MDTELQTQIIEFVDTGLNIRVDPKRIPPGSFQFLQNIISELEGGLTLRRGRVVVGQEPGQFPHTYAKFVVTNNEAPGFPSGNYRYIGDRGDIYRTQNFGSFTNVAGDGYGSSAQVCPTPTPGGTMSGLWSATTYNAGTTGVPQEFFATVNFMLKDSGQNPVGPGGLKKWGILPAFGVPTALSVQVTDASNATPIVITTNLPHNQQNGDEVDIRGVLGNTAANGQFFVNIIVPVSGQSTQFQLYSDSARTMPVSGNGAYISGGFVSNDQGAFPNGGAPGSPAGTLPYKYVYTYASSATNWEGNPTQIMLSDSQVTTVINGITYNIGQPQTSFNNYIQINGIYGTDDPQVDLIYLYRAGGSLTDGIYRRIQVFGNLGLGNTLPAYNDVAPDTAIVNQPQVNFDHDPPVPSTAKNPLRSQLNAIGTLGPGRVTFLTNSAIFESGFLFPYGATRGSTMHIIGGEDVTIEFITSPQTAVVYLQKSYGNNTLVEIDTVCNQSCNLTTQAFDSIFIAGDPANPHILYKSKTGFPEAFPVADASGTVLQLLVSDPGNPIVNITEFRGNILCMCAKSFYEVPVFNGVMLPANITPAQRGLYAKDAWCRVDNAIWYLGYDGIYSWDGAQSIKMSEAVDLIFHNFRSTLGTVNELAPINFSPSWAQYTRMCYYHNLVHVIYIDVDALTWELVYDTRAGRWYQNEKSNGHIGGQEERVLFTENDTGNLIYLRDGGFCCIDDSEDTNNNTSDEYSGSPIGSGTTIRGIAVTGWLDCGDQYVNKVFDEILIDFDPGGPLFGNALVVTVYTDYSWATVVDTFSIPAAAVSQRQWFSFIMNQQSNTGWNREAKVIAFGFVMVGGPLRPTMYGMKLRWRAVGQITAGPVYDWNNLGHPWDKRLTEFTVEFDTQSTARTLILDTIGGLNGNNVSTGVGTYTFSNAIITGPGRGLQVFPVSDGTICKLVRLRADTSTAFASAAGSQFFRLLNVDFQFTKFPPDISSFTEPNDFGYPCEKVARNLILKIDTGGVVCGVNLIGDGSTVATFNVSTTLDDWERIIPVQTNPDVIARLYKLSFTPGVNGKAQLFDWSLDYVKEPCAVNLVDTFETDFGFNGWKYIYQGWFDYFSVGPLLLNIYRDTGILYYSGTLPAHSAFRDVERLYFPIQFGSTFNKSKKYRIKITGQSSQSLKLYTNTRLEWLPWNGDQRAGWQQFNVSPEQQLPTG
jgi:hypothetical protein